MNNIEHWVSSKEIAEHLGINKDTLQKWINSGSIPCHRVGRLWKFKISEVDSWIESGNASMLEVSSQSNLNNDSMEG